MRGAAQIPDRICKRIQDSFGNRSFIQVRLHMSIIGWFSKQQHSPAAARCFAGLVGVAILLLMTVAAVAQDPAAPIPPPESQMSIPSGYSMHQAVDFGGRISDQVGSGAMYDNLVNLKTGPRILGQTFEMHALPTNKSPLVDDLKAFGSGFGGDPYNIVKVDASKSKYYEFSALFRRSRRYFDYDLLGNSNVPGGQTIPIGPSTAPTGLYTYPQENQSPFLFNTVRRMTDTNLTLFPLATWTFRIAYAKNISQGPTYTPSGYQLAGSYSMVLGEYTRNSTDDLTFGVDWKPVQGTKLTLEEQLSHFKGDSYFTLGPSYLNVQEADGTVASLLTNEYNLSPYAVSSCNTNSMGAGNYTSSSNYTMFTAPPNGGPPVINPACAVMTGYQRYQPTRVMFPTEVFRLQSASLKNISMNGDVRFTNANMSLPNYYDAFEGLSGTSRSITYTGDASAQRQVLSADYGVSWQTTDRFSLSEQISFSTWHQPGTTNMTSGVTLATPAVANEETINYLPLISTATKTGTAPFEGGAGVNTPAFGYMGQLYVTNNITGTWDVSPRTTLGVTYRYQKHDVAEGIPHNAPLPVGDTTISATVGGVFVMNENAGILNIATRPATNWDLNGSVEIGYDDNVLTPVSPRQFRQYRVHTVYKPAPWASISGAYNDVEKHNNSNNNAATAAIPAAAAPYEGPLDYVSYSRLASVAASVYPNEHYGVDVDYTYSDVYSADNICFDNGNQNLSTKPGVYPGTATVTASGAPNLCPGVFTRGSTTELADWYGRDFMHAPTQFGMVAFSWAPTVKAHYGVGYRLSSVNGTRFFTDARDVNGSLVSSYQTPYLNASYALHPGWVVKAEYDFFGYGEGGPSGPQLCSLSTDNGAVSGTPSTVSPCTSFAGVTGVTGLTGRPWGQTAPRNFHANNIVLGLHYEF
jgi:hypothetical protein